MSPAAAIPPPRPPTTRYTLVAIVLVDLIGMTMVIPLLPNYAKSLHASGLELGLLLAVFNIMQLFFSPVLGRLSDRVGRRPVLILTMLGAAASYLILALGDFLQAFWILFAARIIGGITGANISVAQTVMSDITGPQDRAAGMGLLGAAFGVGFVLGPALTAVSGIHYTWLPGVIAAGMSLLAALSVWRRLPETLVRTAPAIASSPSLVYWHYLPLQPHLWRDVFRQKGLAELLILANLNMLAFSMLHSTFIPLLRDRPFAPLGAGQAPFRFTQTTSTLMFVYVGLWVVVVQGWLIGRLSRRFGEYACVMTGVGMLAAGFFFLPLCFSMLTLLGSIAIYAIGNGLAHPGYLSLISRSSPAALRGQVLGLCGGLTSLAQAIGQTAGGWLYDVSLWPNQIGPTHLRALPFWTSVTLYLGCFIALVWLRRRHRLEPVTSGSTG